MITKRIPAFTIPELMVVMLLSGIIISAMYLLLQFSFSNYFRYYTVTEKMNAMLRMEYLITKDINTSAVLQKTANGFSFTEMKGRIQYTITDTLLIRTSGITDTLHAEAVSCALYLHDEPVMQPDALADRILISIRIKGQELTMQYQQEPDAKSYILMEETYGSRIK